MSIDNDKPLLLLDMSAAFDTVDHNGVLFSRLKDTFDLSGKVLEQYQSYLEQCPQKVYVDGILSYVLSLLSDVSQVVFSMYIRPLSQAILSQRYIGI